MDDPFRPPQPRRLARRVLDLIRGDDDLERERIGIEKAESILAWVESPYHKEFVKWLRQQADKPMEIDVHAKMIVSSARSNTLREVLQRLEVLERKARGTMEREDT